MNRVDVIIDTNVLWSGTSINERAVRDLEVLQSEGRIRLHIPEVVVLELIRHVENADIKFRKEAQKFQACLRSAGIPDVVTTPSNIKWDLSVRSLLGNLAVIDPLPRVTHAELVARDLGGRKPFQSTGKGYRDALIWETLLDVATTPNVLVLLTANKADFGAGELPPDLKSDLLRDATVFVLPAITELRKWLDDPQAIRTNYHLVGGMEAPLTLGAIKASLDGWHNESANRVRLGRRLSVQAEVEEITVEGVRSVVELQIDEDYGGFEAELYVDAEVVAEISRSQLGILDYDVFIGEIAEDQESIEVRAARQLIVNATFTYRLDTLDIEEARIEEIWHEPPPRQEIVG